MIKIYKSKEDIFNELNIIGAFNKKLIIGIDGKDGVGKTRLAMYLNNNMNCTIISLDKFLERNTEMYAKSINLKEIKNNIENTNRTIIIEGVCLLHIVQRLSIRIDKLIYVKRTRHGTWVDEEICLPLESLDLVFEKQRNKIFYYLEWDAYEKEKNSPNINDIVLPKFTKEIIKYHGKYSPSLKADYIYEVVHA